MNQSNKKSINSTEVKGLLTIYVFITLFLVLFDFFEIKGMVYVFKPMLIPILVFIYFKTSKKINELFLLALFFAFVANILFISKEDISTKIATYFYISSRILIFFTVFNHYDGKHKLPILLGSIPFFWVFNYLLILSFSKVTPDFVFFLSQAVLMSLMCGYSISKYILTDKKRFYFLLMSCICFTLIECVFIIQYYYIDVFIFKPITVILFAYGQYAFLKYLVISDNRD